MGPVKSVVIAAVLAGSVPVRADPIDRWAGDVAEASARFKIPRQWIRRVIRAESNGQLMLKGRPVVSRAGAVGLMQLMPGTWFEMRSELALGADPFDPHDNIIAGTAYLKSMYERFGYPGLFAAYNAGPTRYAEFLSGESSLPAETRAYVARIVPARTFHGRLIGPALSKLFALRAGRGGEGSAPSRVAVSLAGELLVQTSGLGAR